MGGLGRTGTYLTPSSSIYSFGGDLRFSAFTSRFLVVDFSSSVLLVSIMSPSSVEMTCCCLRGFFLGEAPGGKSLEGIERLLGSSVRDGDTVFVVRGGTAETGRIISIGSTSSLMFISDTTGPSTVESTPPIVDGGGGGATIVVEMG